jgi:phosphoribosylaminoimidazolecarboxamide formyltransferase / IMP cyclohydrolase
MSHRVQRALISVSDKSGIEGFARLLVQGGIELLSTGGTHRLLRAAGVPVREVSEVTGYPELMDGRVKTLHPRVHGGILARREQAADVEAMRAHGIPAIDLVVVNLYPFQETIARSGVTRAQAIEEIDIGGPAMVRSAAKNHAHVAVVTDPADYGTVLDELERNGGAIGEALRRRLALKAFELTARYDAAISAWLLGEEAAAGGAELPESAALAGRRTAAMRYGENPHQAAALYAVAGCREANVVGAEVLNGKALSFNNVVDLDAALSLAKEFEEPFACVIKHTNPCGAAVAPALAQAMAEAWSGDPVSAFGSVIALNRPLDLATARFLTSGGRFVEAVIAPSFEQEALRELTEGPKWGKNVRLLACGPFGPGARDARELELKRVIGGFLLQTRDLKAETAAECRVVTELAPTEEDLRSLLFANRVAKHVKSNSIVLAKGTRVLGVGAGQMSRVDSVGLAVHKAGAEADGSVLASDAFFPFADGVERAMDAGVKAILEPGGSLRDEEVIAACNRRGVPLVFTGARHFKH